MSQRTIVTAALPYANGSIHIGHLVEYCQADMYVRALKRLGHDAIYICANDAHGTPIEVNASSLGVNPEDLIAQVHEEHQRDFARFDVVFDHFSSTHSETNRSIVEEVYSRLRAEGYLEDREIDGNYCEQDGRFLPDRFVKGTCPRCDAPDQYGDVCESCGATYSPIELKDARCVICNNAPTLRRSTHVFFKLSAPKLVEFLKTYLASSALQTEVANYVRHWLETGLRDWCISRDGPYFGFPIPDRPGKFFYVWLDAPFGYAASAQEWGEARGLTFSDLWCSEQTRIEHVIGKDIVYFHTLFWPAVLHAVGYSIPERIHVHGMLTVDGEKMSKSRGTFIRAADFASHVNPQALRYYYACKYNAQSDDLDLSFADFVLRVNSELVNKHANLFSRCTQFLTHRLEGQLGDLPFSPQEAQEPAPGDPDALVGLASAVVEHCRRVEVLYEQREFSQAMRELAAVADLGNEFFQSRKPWDEIQSDKEGARLTCTFAANVCHALAMYLWPIVPEFAEAGARVLGSCIDKLDASTLFAERNRAIGTFERLFERIDKKAFTALVETSKTSDKPPAKKGSSGGSTAPGKPQISYEEFTKLDLRVGTVIKAEALPKAKKLLRLLVDVGEAEPRQIVAGIAQAYAPEELEGQRVVVVVNLAPVKLMGVESCGMLLAGGDGAGLAVVRPDKDLDTGVAIT